MRPIVSIFLGAGLLAACTPASMPPKASAPPPAALTALPEAGLPPLQVNAARSLVTFRVHRAGPLARLGHEHVLASHALAGEVSPATGIARLTLPLATLTVDEPALREAAGLDPDVTAEAIAGTRRNLQERVLETARYPLARILIRRLAADQLEVRMEVHGVVHTQAVPVQLETRSDGSILARGDFVVHQRDFGLTPLAVLGGALQVADAVEVHFQVVTDAVAKP